MLKDKSLLSLRCSCCCMLFKGKPALYEVLKCQTVISLVTEYQCMHLLLTATPAVSTCQEAVTTHSEALSVCRYCRGNDFGAGIAD